MVKFSGAWHGSFMTEIAVDLPDRVLPRNRTLRFEVPINSKPFCAQTACLACESSSRVTPGSPSSSSSSLKVRSVAVGVSGVAAAIVTGGRFGREVREVGGEDEDE